MADILLVEDHPVFSDPIRAVLELDGHVVRLAADGMSALAALSDRVPDLVVLDLKMPGMGGPQVLACMRGTEGLRTVPVVVLTMDTSRTCVLELARLGVVAYLSKVEFSLDRLLRVVGEAVKTPAMGARDQSATDHASQADTLASGHGPAVMLGPRETSEALRSLTPVISKADAAACAAQGAQLADLSAAASELLAMTARRDFRLDMLTAVIERDTNLSGMLVRLTNSRAYSRGSAVDSVQRALAQLGRERIRPALLALGLVQRYQSMAMARPLCAVGFWEHSAACAVIAAEMARAFEPESAGAALLCGLLHDIGRLVLAEQLGEKYKDVLQTARRLQAPLEQVEARMLTTTHAEVAAEIIRRWNVPLLDPIALHHTPLSGLRGLPQERLLPASRLIAANRIAHALRIGRSGNDTISPTVELCRLLGLDSATLTRIRTEAPELAQSLIQALASGVMPARREPGQNLGTAPFRPVFIGAEPSLDAHAIFCSEMVEAETVGPPAVAIAYTGQDEDLTSLTDRLLEAEQHEGAARLPLLVLSTRGDLRLDRGITHSRPTAVLRTPVSILRFLAAIEGLLRRA